jgi:hypothetical protein
MSFAHCSAVRVLAEPGNAEVRDFFERVGGNPILTEREFEKGEEDAATVVEGLRLRVAALAMGGKGLAGELGEGSAGEGCDKAIETDADVLELALGKHAVGVLLLLAREVGLDGGLDGDLTLGGAVVGEGVVEVEREGLGRVGETAESGLGFVELLIGQVSGGGADAGFRLHALDVQGLALGDGVGAGREVFADSLTVEPTGDAKNDLPGGIREF